MTAVTIEGKDYDVQMVPVIGCESCGRRTTTGLCGCPSPDRSVVGEMALGVPTSTTSTLGALPKGVSRG